MSALREIHRKGYNATSVNDILASTGLTKGAMYHHFPNKQAVGHAILELIEQNIRSHWVETLEGCDEPLTRIQEILEKEVGYLDSEKVKLGCLLNNLSQEMSAQDEDFRQRLAKIYDLWRKGIAEALRRGQKAGNVNLAVDPSSTATFFVASLAGMRGLAKTTRNTEVIAVCTDNLNRYLETLRVHV